MRPPRRPATCQAARNQGTLSLMGSPTNSTQATAAGATAGGGIADDAMTPGAGAGAAAATTTHAADEPTYEQVAQYEQTIR